MVGERDDLLLVRQVRGVGERGPDVLGAKRGKERRVCSSDAPSARESRMTATGMRVPRAQMVPLQMSRVATRCLVHGLVMGEWT